MKSNVPLQTSIGFSNPAQKVWYAAHVLLAACTSSPAVLVRAAVAPVLGKAAVLAQTAKPARAATPIVLATANTTGYAFGELYLNSPAYPIGTAIPAISPKPASAAVVAQDAVVAQPAVAAIQLPAVAAIKGYEDAITITQSADSLIVVAEIPTASSVGIVGSHKLVIGEITPSALQATAWLQAKASDTANPATDFSSTLEQYLYNNALLCNHTISDIVKNVNGVSINCKRIVVTIIPGIGFDPTSDDLQLDKLGAIIPPSILAEITAPGSYSIGVPFIGIENTSPFKLLVSHFGDNEVYTPYNPGQYILGASQTSQALVAIVQAVLP